MYKAMYMQTSLNGVSVSQLRLSVDGGQQADQRLLSAFFHTIHCAFMCSLEALNPYITKALNRESTIRDTVCNIDQLPVLVSSAVSCSITSMWSKPALH